MASKPRTWRCQRVRGGVKCATDNPAVKQKCTTCGSPRPARKRKAHFDVLDFPYWVFVMVNGEYGERCGICGAPPTAKRNDRDHEHVGAGLVRGLLCHRCNRVLGKRMESESWRGINLEAFL
jgi:hypothetical protein